MRLLLDTHALAWWVLDDPRLSQAAMSANVAPDNDIFISTVSAFEMATKHRLGKWDDIGEFVRVFGVAVAAEGFEIVDINAAHAVLADLMPGNHRDPFDRLLAAQAEIEGLALVTNDPAFEMFPVQSVW